MAVKNYVVRLVDIEKSTKSGVGSDADKVKSYLSTWYTAVCQKASSGDDTWNADVGWLDSPPAAKPRTRSWVPEPRDRTQIRRSGYP